MLFRLIFDGSIIVLPIISFELIEHELIEHVWITPLDALRRYEQKNFRLVFPTLMTLKMLSSYRTADQAIRAAKNEIPVYQAQGVKKPRIHFG